MRRLLSPDGTTRVGNGLVEAFTVCGERIVGVPSDEPPPFPTCEHCLAAGQG